MQRFRICTVDEYHATFFIFALNSVISLILQQYLD